MTLTQEILLEAFEYKEGILYWKNPTSRSVKIGNEVGCKNSNGYRLASIKGKYIQTHRAIFLMHYGYLPEYVDHIDGNKSNNKVENLRAVTKAQNAWNSKLPSTNKSGIRGVSWNKQTNKWRVAINVNGRAIHLGRFSDIKDAQKVIESARIQYHGQYARQK
jgi:hypothetical protein